MGSSTRPEILSLKYIPSSKSGNGSDNVSHIYKSDRKKPKIVFLRHSNLKRNRSVLGALSFQSNTGTKRQAYASLQILQDFSHSASVSFEVSTGSETQKKSSTFATGKSFKIVHDGGITLLPAERVSASDDNNLYVRGQKSRNKRGGSAIFVPGDSKSN